MGYSTAKARRRAYQRSLKASRGCPDRFTERMEALMAGGTQPCICCELARPRTALNDSGVCQWCAASLGKAARAVPAPTRTTLTEPHVVWADASFRDGIAGLAVAGALGEHVQQTTAVSSTQAEVLAVKWAMEIAERAGIVGLTFRTDCQAAFLTLGCRYLRTEGGARLGLGKRQHDWWIEQVPRHLNHRADRLAGETRLAS